MKKVFIICSKSEYDYIIKNKKDFVKENEVFLKPFNFISNEEIINNLDFQALKFVSNQFECPQKSFSYYLKRKKLELIWHKLKYLHAIKEMKKADFVVIFNSVSSQLTKVELQERLMEFNYLKQLDNTIVKENKNIFLKTKKLQYPL